MNNEGLQSIEEYKFEPIKGYPMLSWKGKRPYTSTQYYPAQLKETYGNPNQEWMNKIFWGDNLQVMSHLLKEFRGKIDLVYIDPPFDSKADYKKKIALKGKKIDGDNHFFEEVQYTDLWSNDEYLQFMYERLTLLRELLSDRGSIWLHCDWRRSHHLRMLLDEIFGPENFKGHITWRTMTSSGYKGKKSLGKNHADILYYTKNAENFIYNPVYLPISENMLARYKHQDPDGRLFKDSYLGDVSPEGLKQLKSENRLYITSTGGYRKKQYLDEAEGTLVDDVWVDISAENSQSHIQTGYPTQKPEKLLERIISLASNENSIVFDCFMGSGTTQAVALKNNRRFIGADINLGSVKIATKRLLEIVNGEMGKGVAGFEVYNVNNYDVFHNPVQAKSLIIEALEIQATPKSSVFDGEKDGYSVKIMPVNRIATKADLNELITNLDYQTLEQRQKDNPNQYVENILLVCMGHEADLAATLKKEVPFKINVEVVDILRDRANLEFKRDAEALIKINNNQLIIQNFYPMNLLQKLSIMKENVGDWKELVESVMIDWNYDGAILEPTEVDIPSKNDFVKGIYQIPESAGTIRVKITDLLSESLEVSIENE